MIARHGMIGYGQDLQVEIILKKNQSKTGFKGVRWLQNLFLLLHNNYETTCVGSCSVTIDVKARTFVQTLKKIKMI